MDILNVLEKATQINSVSGSENEIRKFETMIIETEEELIGMKKVSEAVAVTLKEMKDFVKPGMSTLELDQFGATIMAKFGC